MNADKVIEKLNEYATLGGEVGDVAKSAISLIGNNQPHPLPDNPEWNASYTKRVVEALISAWGDEPEPEEQAAIDLLVDYHVSQHSVYAQQEAVYRRFNALRADLNKIAAQANVI
jgi:hypothetical protein